MADPLRVSDDTGNSRVRMIRTDGTMQTFAGTGQVGETGDGGPAAAAQLASPKGIAVDNAGIVYISDNGSGLVRAVIAGDGGMREMRSSMAWAHSRWARLARSTCSTN